MIDYRLKILNVALEDSQKANYIKQIGLDIDDVVNNTTHQQMYRSVKEMTTTVYFGDSIESRVVLMRGSEYDLLVQTINEIKESQQPMTEEQDSVLEILLTSEDIVPPIK